MTHPRPQPHLQLPGRQPIPPQIEYSRKTPLLNAGDTVHLLQRRRVGPARQRPWLLRLFDDTNVMQAVPRVMDEAEAARRRNLRQPDHGRAELARQLRTRKTPAAR
jgi:hypothetical protein